MRELLRSNDLVHLSWAQAALSAAGHRQCRCSMPTSAASRATSERFRAASWSTTTSWSAPGKCSPGPNKRSRVAEHLTDDHLLGGRVRFSQPARGYRVAIDPVLLAAAVPARRRGARARRGGRHRRGQPVPGGAGAGLPHRRAGAAAPAAAHRQPQRDAERARRTGRDGRRQTGAAAAPAGRGQLRPRDDQSAPSRGGRRQPVARS